MLSINGLNNLPENVVMGGGSDQIEAEQPQDNSIFDDLTLWDTDTIDPGIALELPDLLTSDDDSSSGFKELC